MRMWPNWRVMTDEILCHATTEALLVSNKVSVKNAGPQLQRELFSDRLLAGSLSDVKMSYKVVWGSWTGGNKTEIEIKTLQWLIWQSPWVISRPFMVATWHYRSSTTFLGCKHLCPLFASPHKNEDNLKKKMRHQFFKVLRSFYNQNGVYLKKILQYLRLYFAIEISIICKLIWH